MCLKENASVEFAGENPLKLKTAVYSLGRRLGV